MLIGELSQKSGLSRDTIRWYEKVGLLSCDKALRGSNNYRKYDNAALDTLLLIKQSKSFGFSLNEIKEFLSLIETDDLDCATMEPMIDSKLNMLNEKITALQSIHDRLLRLKELCSGDCEAEILNAQSQ